MSYIQSSAPAGIPNTPPLSTAGVTFEVDVSRTYRNKDGYQAGGYRLNVSFETETHTPETFIESVVKEGWPYTMVFNHDRWPAETGAAARDVKTPKHIENFISRQELTFDDDSQTTGVIDFWLSDPFFARYGFAFVESVNSIAGEAEKGHPTIILDRPICDPAILKSCYKAMAWHYDRLDPLHNIDRTIYNAEGARVHLVGNVCPWPVFKDVILQPWIEEQKRIEAERDAERDARLAEYEQARADGRLATDAGSIERYLTATVDGIVNWLARQATGRHTSLYSAGVLIGRLEAADWTRPFAHLLNVEGAIIQATITNGYFDDYAHNEAEVLRTFSAGQRLGQAQPADPPQLYHTPAGDLHSTDGRLATPRYEVGPYVLSDDAKKRRDEALRDAKKRRVAKETAAADRAAELERRYQAGVAIAFAGDVPDPEQLERLRQSFSSARRWRDYCRAHWPDIDADAQYQIKLEENREARPDRCGEYRKFVLPNGQTVTRRWTCGVCDECQKRGVWIYRRALGEITGQPVASTAEPLSLEELQADLDRDEDAPRENAPPLPVVHGDLTLVTVYSSEERLKLARDLRRAGVAYRCQPLEAGGQLAFDFLVNDDRGEPLVLLTDGRLAGWVRGYKNKRASGAMLPSLKKLQKRYRPALPYEVILPELDDEGQPVDPDIFALDLPDIGTSAQLPPVLVDFRVYDASTLQAALIEINNQQCKILGRRGDVNYGVYSKKRMYTRYSTLDRMIAEFNAWQDEIRAKKQLE